MSGNSHEQDPYEPGSSQEPEAAEERLPGPADGADDTAQQAEGDPLSQVEEILNNAEVDAEGSVAQGSDQHDAHELRNDLLRLQAEYVNYRKRVERDRAVAGESAVVGVLNSVLPVLDDIGAARAHGDLDEGPFAAIALKLETVLGTYGLERIDETGVSFDPTVHEALIQQPSAEVEADTVSEVLRPGYRKGERVLRAAQVIVAVPE